MDAWKNLQVQAEHNPMVYDLFMPFAYYCAGVGGFRASREANWIALRTFGSLNAQIRRNVIVDESQDFDQIKQVFDTSEVRGVKNNEDLLKVLLKARRIIESYDQLSPEAIVSTYDALDTNSKKIARYALSIMQDGYHQPLGDRVELTEPVEASFDMWGQFLTEKFPQEKGMSVNYKEWKWPSKKMLMTDSTGARRIVGPVSTVEIPGWAVTLLRQKFGWIGYWISGRMNLSSLSLFLPRTLFEALLSNRGADLIPYGELELLLSESRED